MDKQYTIVERIRLIQQEIAIWEHRDPQYTDLLYAELNEQNILFEREEEEFQLWCDLAVEGVDYDIVVPDQIEEKKEIIEPVIKQSESDFQSNEFYRKIDDIHKALFNNPNKTKDQKEEEMIELMKARKLMQGVKKRNSGK